MRINKVLKFRYRLFLFFCALLLKGLGLGGAPLLANEDSEKEPSEKVHRLNHLSEEDELPARTVRFDLRPVPGALEYEVEVNSRSQRWQSPYYFRTREPRLRVRLTPGYYRARTRTYNQARLFGPWSRGFDFTIVYRPPRDVYPPHGAQLKPIGDSAEKITFEWPTDRRAFAYLFELRDALGETLTRRLIRSHFTTETLPINQQYSWSITPLLHLGAEDDPNLERLFYHFEVLEPVEDLKPVSIQVSKRLIAHRYEFEFVRFISADETSEPSTYTSPLPEFRARLSPGEYEMRVRAVYVDNTKSHWSPPSRFYVPFSPPEVILPKARRRLRPNHHLLSQTEFAWTSVAGAPRYVLYIYDEEGRLHKRHETAETSATVGLPPDRTYSYSVKAYNFTESGRSPASVEKGDRSVRINKYYLAQLSTAEEPSDIYAWASYWISQVDYESLSYDDNSLTTNSILGGSGELALGYWHRQTRLGLLGFANLSGFNIGSSNYQYFTYGAQLGYRQLIDARSRYRLWAGWAFKELPQLITRPGTDFLDVQNIQTQGLFLQAAYLRDINQTYGWSIQGSYYHSMGRNTTPNGLPLESLESLQLGIYATKAMGTHNRYRGRIGYTYKNESLNYPTIDPIGINNQVRIEGHYLSFILEMGLRDLPENVYGR